MSESVTLTTCAPTFTRAYATRPEPTIRLPVCAKIAEDSLKALLQENGDAELVRNGNEGVELRRMIEEDAKLSQEMAELEEDLRELGSRNSQLQRKLDGLREVDTERSALAVAARRLEMHDASLQESPEGILSAAIGFPSSVYNMRFIRFLRSW